MKAWSQGEGAAIGVDVVDRRTPRLQRGLPKERTVRRILSAAEAARLASSADPVRDFWLHWGAKEAAFKAVTLLRGVPPVFSHARFEVELDEERVRYEEFELALAVTVTPERLVVVARPAGAAPPTRWQADTVAQLHAEVGRLDLETLRVTHFSPPERDTVRGLPSALVRLAVRREAARWMEVEERRLEVICPPGPAGRRPPYLHLEGRPLTDVGISISHDGEWLAWGLAFDPGAVSAARGGS